MAAPADSTADLILDAAEALFARQGYEATSIKQLGAAAGVNGALLYYYFGDKRGLYAAVLGRVLDGLADAVAGHLAEARSPADAVRRVVGAQAELLLTRPHLARLLVREMVDHEAEQAQALAVNLVQRAFEGLCAAIRAGQASGAFRRDVRAEYAAYSILGQLVYVVVARPLFVARLGERAGLRDAGELRAFAAHAADFALAALAAPAPEARTP